MNALRHVDWVSSSMNGPHARTHLYLIRQRMATRSTASVQLSIVGVQV